MKSIKNSQTQYSVAAFFFLQITFLKEESFKIVSWAEKNRKKEIINLLHEFKMHHYKTGMVFTLRFK